MEKSAIITLKKKGQSDRKIARDLKCNRRTVKKYWNAYLEQEEALKLLDDVEAIRTIQEKMTAAPKYNSTNRNPPKYTNEIDEMLDSILESEKEKVLLLGDSNKQKLSNVQIHKMIKDAGFDIGLTVISAHVRIKRQKILEAYIRQEYDFGDRLEYDFGEVRLIIGGEYGKYHLAVFGSPAGKFRWAYLYKNEKKEVFMDSHVRFFVMVGGVFKEVVYDNMKNVVAKFIGRNEKDLNEDLVKMALYYGFEINVTNCFSGNEKGYVESSVKKMQRDVFGPRYKFDTFEDAVEYLEKELVKLNADSMIEEEKKHLLPERPPLELAKISKNNVDKYSFVRVDNNFYSVPDYMVGRDVTVKNYPAEIIMYSGMNEICRHIKIDGFQEMSVDIFHYLDTLARKPKALKNAKALKCKKELKAVYDQYFSKKPRDFIALLKEHQDKSLDDIARILEYAGRNDGVHMYQQTSDIADNVLKHTMSQLSAISNFFMKGGDGVEH